MCLRAGQAGREVHYCCQCEVIHYESVSPGRFSHDARNVSLYRERWMQRIEPDEWRFYLEDGLIKVSHEGRYPIQLEVSPLLATIAHEGRLDEREKLLRKQSRQIADYLKENTRLRTEIAARSTPSKELEYHALRKRIRRQVRETIPPGATVAFVSKGDLALVDMDGYEGWHFPRDKNGAYAGFHPTDSNAAISHLKDLMDQGAGYLVIPATSEWWLKHYAEFSSYLDTHFPSPLHADQTCRIYGLTATITALGGSL